MGGQREASGGQREAVGSQREALGGQREAKGRPEPPLGLLLASPWPPFGPPWGTKGRPRRGQGRPRGGQGEARRGQRTPNQARDENKPKPSQGYPFFWSQKASLFGGPRLPKSSQNRESDFLKMSVSPRRRAHFQREGQAKPGQKGLAKQGKARQGLLGPTGEAQASQHDGPYHPSL